MNFEIQLQKYWALKSLFRMMEVYMKKNFMTIKDKDIVNLNDQMRKGIKANEEMVTQLYWY